MENICYWYDGSDYHLTRCTIDMATGKPINLPPEADIMLIIEFAKDYEPTFYDETAITEMGVYNAFP